VPIGAGDVNLSTFLELARSDLKALKTFLIAQNLPLTEAAGEPNHHITPHQSFVPLALAILAPIIVNIALYHAVMAPHGGGLVAATTALWVTVFLRERSAFAGLLASRPGRLDAPNHS
jgi:hypothetical protein